jgi:hypothetical protein
MESKKQRHAAAQKKYRQRKYAIPGLRYEIQVLIKKYTALTGQSYQSQGEPVRDMPPPDLPKKARETYMANSLERFNCAVFNWLRAEKIGLQARIAEHVLKHT